MGRLVEASVTVPVTLPNPKSPGMGAKVTVGVIVGVEVGTGVTPALTKLQATRSRRSTGKKRSVFRFISSHFLVAVRVERSNT